MAVGSRRHFFGRSAGRGVIAAENVDCLRLRGQDATERLRTGGPKAGNRIRSLRTEHSRMQKGRLRAESRGDEHGSILGHRTCATGTPPAYV